MSNEPVWTPWIQYLGGGECPIPEWAEAHQVILADGMESPVNDLNPNNWKWSDDCGGEITHYRYAVPADLAWLANAVSDFHGAYYISVENGVPSLTSKPYNHGDYYTKDQWLRARRDLGYENQEYPECPPNFRCIKQPSVQESAPSKYHRNIKGVWADVYDIIYAYGITNPGDQHALKKMLQPGKRGYKDAAQDREEAIVSLKRANELEGEG